jgi:hypothetical protein
MPMAAPGSPPPSIQVIAPWWRESHLLAIGWAMGDAEITGAGMVANGISRGATDIQ